MSMAKIKLSIFNEPIQTLTLFFQFIYEEINNIILYLVKNKKTTFTVLTISFFLLEIISIYFNYILVNIVNAIYWTFLGILSSIGLGFGIHTGILFLFPLIIRVSLLSKNCHNTNFEIYGNNSFVCTKDDISNVNIFDVYLKIFIESFFGVLAQHWEKYHHFG